MHKACWSVVGALLAVAIATPSVGAPVNLTKPSGGWVYFNRPGADMTSTEAQMGACAIAVHGWRPGADEVAGQGLLVDLVGGAMQNAFLRTSLEHCMVLRGWRVVRAPDAEGEALAKLTPAALAEKLGPWVGAENPPGEVVRAWANEASKADTIVHVFLPGTSAKPALNALALSSTKSVDLPRAPKVPSPFERPAKAVLVKSKAPAELAAAPADSAVVIFTLRNSAPTDWTRLTFVRQGPSLENPAYRDGQPDVIFLFIKDRAKGGPKGSAVSQTFAFVVPPGRWALDSISDMVSLCLGAPFFDVRAGDVLNMGAMDFGRDGRPIDLDPTPVRAFLSEQPSLAAKLKPAAWANGAILPCLNYTYAMEYPDLPFADGYVRGGTPTVTPSR